MTPLPPKKRNKRARSPLKRPLGPPTPHLVNTLEALRVLTEALGGPPSATQLGTHLGISRIGARKLLKRLEARGLARDVPKQVSSGQWAITPDGDRALELK